MVRKTVRSTILRAALGGYRCLCLGYLLGNMNEDGSVSIDFALGGTRQRESDSLSISEEIRRLRSLRRAADETAHAFGKSTVGLFGAYADESGDYFLRMGALVDCARKEQLTFLMIVPTDGGESFWADSIYDCRQFPGPEVECIRVKLRVASESDNPRRVQSAWRRNLETLPKRPL